ncbi:MAG: hypothetical protein WBW84_15760 [Acidobacteriaceae bacterium]
MNPLCSKAAFPTTMPDTFYPYPFDAKGDAVLTFAESVAASRDLEDQLNKVLPNGWQWSELQFKIIKRGHRVVIYLVERNGKEVGNAMVTPDHLPFWERVGPA